MKTILAAIDFSPVTTRVVAEAVALARGIRARVILLNVTTPEALVRDYAALESLLEGVDPEARRDDVSQTRASIHGDSLQMIGDPVDTIIEQAARCGADYIVLGSHGHSALFEVLVGSTAAGVLKGSACPVIIVPALQVQDALIKRTRPLRRRRPVLWLQRNERRATRIESSARERPCAAP